MAAGDSPQPSIPAAPPPAPPGVAEGPAVVRCPECSAAVADAQLENHLRRAHRVYQFRGVRRNLNDTLAVLLLELAGGRPGPDAWATLEAIAREEHGPRADAFLSALVGQALGRVSPEEQPAVIAAAAGAIVAGGGGPSLIPLLTADPETTPRLLAVALAARLPPPLEPHVLRALLPLLTDRNLPAGLNLELAAVLLRSTGKEGEGASEVFRALIEGLGKARSVDRLRELEQLIGPSTTLEQLASPIEDQIRMTCPRCSVELRRAEMVDHLWQEHRLVLDGRRVREPWPMIEEGVEEYRRAGGGEAGAAILARCRELAKRLDPENGVQRVNRLLLSGGAADEEARRSLLAEAGRRHASLCPQCFALVPVPGEAPARALNLWRGRVSGLGYRVEVGTRGLFTRFEVETPAGVQYRGFEPGRRLTPNGALLVLAGPLVLAAVLVAFGVLAPRLPPFLPVLVLLGAALAVGVFARLRWR